MIIRSFKNLFKKLACPLVSACIQLVIILAIFMEFFEIKDHYYTAISDAKIRKKMQERVSQCGKDFYISWLVLDGNKSKRKYYFKDVIGCNEQTKRKTCAFSVKHLKLNSFYNQTYHKLDEETYNHLATMQTGLVGYYNNPKELVVFDSVNEALGSANKKITSIGLSVTKNIRKNLVYVFTMTKTNNHLGKCGKHEIVEILEDLSIYAKEKI